MGIASYVLRLPYLIRVKKSYFNVISLSLDVPIKFFLWFLIIEKVLEEKK